MIVAQALLIEDGLIIVETADEQVESDEFSFHKTILSLIVNLLPLLLIRISYNRLWRGQLVLRQSGFDD